MDVGRWITQHEQWQVTIGKTMIRQVLFRCTVSDLEFWKPSKLAVPDSELVFPLFFVSPTLLTHIMTQRGKLCFITDNRLHWEKRDWLGSRSWKVCLHGAIIFVEVYVAAVARTPIGGFNGSLGSLTAPKLGSIAIEGNFKACICVIDKVLTWSDI